MALTPAEKQQRYRERQAAKGKCTRCPRKAAPELTVCKKCNEAAKQRVKESRAK